jgi:mannose PTS system EIIA component
VSKTNRPVHGILVTHGHLGRELLATAESIIGKQPEMTVISNQDKSHQALSDEVRLLVEQLLPEGPVVVFVDLVVGGCGRACSPLAARHGQVLVVGGVNLPMLIEFLYNRDRVEMAELKDRIARKGHEAICTTGWQES